jgi:hypothetical protein
VKTLDVQDLSALEAALDAVPEGVWIEVITAGERFLLRRVSGGYYLPGDLVIASGDVCQGKPESVEVIDFEKRLADASYGTADLTTLTPEAKDFLRESGLI